MSHIEDVILFQIDQANKAAKAYSRKILDDMELSITIDQWILLKIIHESEELSQKKLAEKSLRDPVSITRSLDLLQKKGLIIKESIPENKRQYKVILSLEGKNFVSKYIKYYSRMEKKKYRRIY